MKISNCPLQSTKGRVRIFCPRCHCDRYHMHGCYIRKGFHTPGHAAKIVLQVQRYRCLNPDCPVCTFSVLPPMVIRYNRFFWPCLLTIKAALTAGASFYQLAMLWLLSGAVMKRAWGFLNRLSMWVAAHYRELSDGRQHNSLAFMVKFAIAKLGRLELMQRWYRHRYPLRLR